MSYETVPDAPAHSQPTALPRLSDRPNWTYLLREFYDLYRYRSAGGSGTIRSHQKRVRNAISAVFAANPPIISREWGTKPVVAHFTRALDLGDRGAMQGMARSLREVRDNLSWEYGYDRMPSALSRKYAYCEIMGPRGPIEAHGIILGFVLFAPKTVYPTHSHADIEESYISVSGAWSENNSAVYAPGSLILNRSGEEHRITTGDLEPCLLAYAWIGPVDLLSQPTLKFSPRKVKTGAKTSPPRK